MAGVGSNQIEFVICFLLFILFLLLVLARCLNGHVSIWKASQIPAGIAKAVAVIVAHKAARGVTKDRERQSETA